MATDIICLWDFLPEEIKERLVEECFEYDSTITAKVWKQNEVYHRDCDKPAVIYDNGRKEWYQKGVLHRDNDLPAIVAENGTKKWYQNGLLHRVNDKPAIVYKDGGKEWFKEDKRHRGGPGFFSGPAVQRDGIRMYYNEGVMRRNGNNQFIVYERNIAQKGMMNSTVTIEMTIVPP